MKDIIYREDAIDKLNEWESECIWDSWTLKYKDDPKEHIVAPTDVVKNLPSAERTGHWVKVSGYSTPGGDPVWRCSECGKGIHVFGIECYDREVADSQWVACPNCGARMVKE